MHQNWSHGCQWTTKRNTGINKSPTPAKKLSRVRISPKCLILACHTSKCSNSYQMWCRCTTQTDRHISLDTSGSLLMLPNDTDPIDSQPSGSVDATCMPNVTFGAPKLATSTPKASVKYETRDLEATCRYQRTSAKYHREIRNKNKRTHQDWSTSLFSRIHCLILIEDDSSTISNNL